LNPSSDLPYRGVILRRLIDHLPGLVSVHAFGSRISGTARPDSDLDLAVLVDGPVDLLTLWGLSGELADLAGCPVDLVDLRSATTVMQYQILTTGERWWAHEPQAGLFEAMVMTEKGWLDVARRGVIEDVAQRGTVHGR
jgi:predicted nucleotidyltransferase